MNIKYCSDQNFLLQCLGAIAESRPTTLGLGAHPAGQLLRAVQQFVTFPDGSAEPRSINELHETLFFQRLLETAPGPFDSPDAGHLHGNLKELGQRARRGAVSRNHRQLGHLPLGLGGNRLPPSVLGNL